MLHVRADTEADGGERLAKAFASNVVISSDGLRRTLRRAATDHGTPIITVELGEAYRFQRPLIDAALEGVMSAMVELGMRATERVKWPGWRTVIDGSDENTWLRADVGGLVEMHADRGALVEADDAICTITNPFKTDSTVVEALFTGLLVGVLENPLVSPGNPLCHLVALDDTTLRTLRMSGDAPGR